MKKIFFVFSLLITGYLITGYPNVPSTLAQTKESSPAATTIINGQGVMGKVLGVVNKTISLTQSGGAQIDLTTTEVTKFVKVGRRILLKDVKAGDEVVAVGGLVPTDNTFLVKTLIVKPKVLKRLDKTSFHGTVLGLGENSFTLSSTKRGSPVEVAVTSQTTLRSKNKKIKLSQLQVGDRLVAIVLKETNNNLTGRLVVVVKTAPKVTQEASPTATPTP